VTVVVLTEVVGDADDVAVGVAEDVAAEDVAAEDVAEEVAVEAPGAKRAWWKSVQVSRWSTVSPSDTRNTSGVSE
jgi:hypothetical protein